VLNMMRLTACAVAVLLLQSCFFAPGKFASTLELRRGGQFSFSYQGEILFVNELGREDQKPELENCWGPAPGSDEAPPPIVRTRPGTAPEASETIKPRPCTAAERAERTRQWERQREQQAAMLGAVFGFNPNDPRSIEAFTTELKKHRGWRAVTHKGGNVFEIDYRIDGSLGHDFTFPIFEGVAVHTPFVIARPRNDKTVEVMAPAFGGGNGGWSSLAALSGGPAAMGRNEYMAELLKRTEGTFTIVTDGDVRTNNTAEGPSARGSDKVLSWRVTTLAREMPRALISL
jgi:hypothetical protein